MYIHYFILSPFVSVLSLTQTHIHLYVYVYVHVFTHVRVHIHIPPSPIHNAKIRMWNSIMAFQSLVADWSNIPAWQ